MRGRWTNFAYSLKGRQAIVHGLNVWAHSWTFTGEYAFPEGFLEHPNVSFPIYAIRKHGRTYLFAAAEVLPDYWVFIYEDQFGDSAGVPATLLPVTPSREAEDPFCLSN